MPANSESSLCSPFWRPSGRKSFWFGVGVVGRAIEHLPKTGRYPLPVQHGPRVHSTLGAALCRRPFHRDSAAGGRLGGGEGRDLTILDLMDQSTQGLRFVLREPRRLPQRSLQILVAGIPTRCDGAPRE